MKLLLYLLAAFLLTSFAIALANDSGENMGKGTDAFNTINQPVTVQENSAIGLVYACISCHSTAARPAQMGEAIFCKITNSRLAHDGLTVQENSAAVLDDSFDNATIDIYTKQPLAASINPVAYVTSATIGSMNPA